MLHLAFAGGLRVSEIVGLALDQFDGRAPASIHILGTGRRERVLPLWQETTACACGHDLHRIGEDVSERLDIVLAQFRVIVTRRPWLSLPGL